VALIVSLTSFFNSLDFFQIATIFGAIGLPFCYWIESIAWILKSLSPVNSIAVGVAKSNVLIYVGRFFYFFTYVSIAYLIDHGVSTDRLQMIFLLAMVICLCIHCFLLNEYLLNKIIFYFARFFRFQYKVLSFENVRVSFDKKVFIYSCLISIALLIALFLPFLLANEFLNYRLTMNSFGQILNVIGTVFLLLALDPILYRKMDQGNLSDVLKPYILGRLMAFFIAVIYLTFDIFLF
jgi:hypothetical protein